MESHDSKLVMLVAHSPFRAVTSSLVKQLFALLVLMVVSGCTHNITYAVPHVPELAPTMTGKGTIAISAISDNRAAGKPELFVFSNPPHKWIYHPDQPAPDTMRKLLLEGLGRRGYTESSSSKDLLSARILDFSGENEPGMWYVGKCLFKISCEVFIEGPNGKKSFITEGHSENLIGRLSDENMDQLLNQTYADFLTNLEKELIKAGY